MAFSGTKLKTCRARKNWSLADLSSQSGVNKGYLSNLENGIQTNPGLDIVERLSVAFRVPLDYFSDLYQGPPAKNLEFPPGLQQLIKKRSKSNMPMDKKSLEFVTQILDRSPNNWSLREWESVYKSYADTHEKSKLKRGK